MLKSTLFCITLAMAAAPNLAGVPASAQRASATDDWCRNENWGGDRQAVCEVRQYTIPATGATLAVDARPNGGIEVNGSSRGDVFVLAKVVANAETKERAQQIASSVQVNAAPDKISATGPEHSDREEGWSVSYRLAVPEHMPLSLESTNGGISISKVDARIEFKTVNGGVKLSALSGDVKGRTSNGGVDVSLDGTIWQGEGLDVQTSNGGVKLVLPENYSAQLQVGTVNGGIHSDIAVPMPESEGPGRRNRNIDVQIGAGGPPIRVHTTNGGVRVTKKD